MELNFKVTDHMLYDYMAFLFDKNTTGQFIISARNDFGKLIIAHTKESLRPAGKIEGEFVARLLLPLNAATINFQNKFIYLSAQATEQLNMSLRAYFNLDFWEYIQHRRSMKVRKEEIVEAFIISRKLFSGEYFESLHKRAYRRELKDLAALKSKLIRRSYYVESLVKTQKNVL